MMEPTQQHPLPLTLPKEEENYQQPVAVAETTLRAGCTLERERRQRRFPLFQISAGNEAGMPRRGPIVVRRARPRPEPQEVGGERRCRRTALANSF
ncbi:hypothetical protein CapIbe_009923 [Capra ibex]